MSIMRITLLALLKSCVHAIPDASRCCFNETLYVYTGDWLGLANGLKQEADGTHSGLLASMLKVMASRMTSQVVYVSQDDCENSFAASGFGASQVYWCRLKQADLEPAAGFGRRVSESGSGEGDTSRDVPVARFTNFWGGLHWDPAMLDKVHLTTSFFEPTQGALLYVSYAKNEYGIFRVFAPFENNLWFAVGLTTLLVGIVLPGVLRDRSSLSGVAGGYRASLRSRGEMVYHAFAEIFGAGDFEWSQNASARILRFGWLFFMLITISSYTANLAAFFTASGRQVLGPQDMTALRSSVACQPGHMNDAADQARLEKEWGAGSVLGSFVMSNMPSDFLNETTGEELSNEGKMVNWGMSTTELITKCAEKVKAGQADLILFDKDQLQQWQLDRDYPLRCREFEFSRGVEVPKHNPTQTFLAINKTIGWDFFVGIQESLAWMRLVAPANVMATIYQQDLRRGESCPAEAEEPSGRISLESQGGVFVLVAAAVVAAVLWSALEAQQSKNIARRKAAGEGEEEEDLNLTDGELLRHMAKELTTLKKQLASGESEEAGSPSKGELNVGVVSIKAAGTISSSSQIAPAAVEVVG